jgi:dihydroxy-acid dehydratase
MADKTEKGGRGIARGLTNYGDPAFARYLRRSFAKSMGYSDAMLDRPVVGIALHPFRLQQPPPAFPSCCRR